MMALLCFPGEVRSGPLGALLGQRRRFLESFCLRVCCGGGEAGEEQKLHPALCSMKVFLRSL